MTERSKGSGVYAGRQINRRDFLKMSGAGLAGAALLGGTACGGGGGSGSGDLIFAMGTDTSGTLQGLIDKFNKQSEGFKVTYQEMPTDTGAYFDKLRTQFQAGGGDIDVIGADVIWPAQFAANGWLLDVTDKFPKSEQSQFLPGPINSLLYDSKIYGVPWFTDAGLLYYRADLLEKSGYSDPPKTWDEMQEMAVKVAKDQKIDYGFVFQGDQYEGGVCNGLEYIWTNGGDVLDPNDPNKVVIDSPEAAAGLAIEQGIVEDGVAPQAVATYTETETDPAFLGNKAVFARNWPYMYALAGTKDYPDVKPEMIGVAPVPVTPGNGLASTLGGWNMLINAQTDMPDEAWEFVSWMTSEQAQRQRAISASLLPTRPALYQDKEIRETIPVIVEGEAALKNARSRPVSPYYSDMSLEMQEQFNGVVKGDISPEDAVSSLQDSLTQIVEAGQ
ncbi:MAG TPA: ABC transporter substrate-binding protein [Rubrobacter sp.]|nr:ABC transporter substrate-binding protein [Rubrobacter sp.]